MRRGAWAWGVGAALLVVEAQAQEVLEAVGESSFLEVGAGPWGGAVVDLAVAPKGEGPFALTQAGVYRWDADEGRWALEEVSFPAEEVGAVPWRVDVGPLGGAGAVTRVGEVSFRALGEGRFEVKGSDGALWRASVGGRWEKIGPAPSWGDGPAWRGAGGEALASWTWGGRSRAVPSVCDGVQGLLVLRDGSAALGIGPRAVCSARSADAQEEGGGFVFGGRFWEATDGPVGSARSAVMFFWEGGVRVLVGTEGILNEDGPGSRARGGRLFLSDDLGQTWKDATPDIDAPGGFVDLEVRQVEGGVEVWLLTERRGAFVSQNGGEGFVRRSVGLAAMPVEAIERDPVLAGELWAATPTGLMHFTGADWLREAAAPISALGARPATEAHLGQLWAGTWYGQVMWRAQAGPWSVEVLPRAEREVGLVVEGGARPRGQGVRVVQRLAPSGLDRTLRDEGYALVEGEGLFRREGGVWAWLGSPTEQRAQVRALLGVPLGDGREGGLLLLAGASADGALGQAWLHDPAGGWRRLDLPLERVPVAAARVGAGVWVAGVGGEVFRLETRAGKLEVSRVLGEAPCALLEEVPEEALEGKVEAGLACVIAPGVGLKDGAQRLGQVLSWGKNDLEGAGGGAPSAARWLAVEPTGRGFGVPVGVTFTRNDVGVHPWVAPGVGVYAGARALRPALEPEPEGILGAWLAVVLPLVGLGGALTLVLLGLLRWRRRRARAREQN